MDSFDRRILAALKNGEPLEFKQLRARKPEDNYHILDTKLVNDELAELVISCAKCGSTIKLTGFQEE